MSPFTVDVRATLNYGLNEQIFGPRQITLTKLLCFRSSLLYVEDSPQNSPLKTPKTLGQQVPETPGAVRVCLIFFVGLLLLNHC